MTSGDDAAAQVPQGPGRGRRGVARIVVALPGLSRSDARVARAILDSPESVLRSSVSDLAERAGTAASTVVRACQRMGFDGFQDLKLTLAQDRVGGQAGLVHAEVPDDASPEVVLGHILAVAERALHDANSTVEVAGFAAASRALSAAEHVVVIGTGQSSAVAQDAAYRMRMIGRDARSPVDAVGQHLAARALQPGDVCVAISHTGSTRQTLTNVQAAHDAGAVTVAVTSFRRSPLTELATVSLVAGSPEQGFRLEAMASRIAHLVVLDALYVVVAMSDQERARAALDATAEVTSSHSL